MKIVIIGAGPAGVSAVETLRAHDHHAEITMLTDEPYQPYSPPAMVDHYLTGSNYHFWRETDWAERMRLEYGSSRRVTSIHPEKKQIKTDESDTLDYDRLVIATGGRLYAPIPGSDLPGVYNFKSLRAAESLIERVRSKEAKTALVVGAGFIGLEIAILLSTLGIKVILVEQEDQVMPRALDPEVASIVLIAMEKRGVEVQLNSKASMFLGKDQAEGVVLESGESLHADVYIAATGVKPTLEPLKGSGIDHNWGIIVDDHLRISAPEVYAAGDVVEAPDRITGDPYVHAIFPNAVEQGKVVGLNLAGFNVTYEGAESMNSLKHLGLSIMGSRGQRRRRNTAGAPEWSVAEALFEGEPIGWISTCSRYPCGRCAALADDPQGRCGHH